MGWNPQGASRASVPAWLSCGVRGELGRGDAAAAAPEYTATQAGSMCQCECKQLCVQWGGGLWGTHKVDVWGRRVLLVRGLAGGLRGLAGRLCLHSSRGSLHPGGRGADRIGLTSAHAPAAAHTPRLHPFPLSRRLPVPWAQASLWLFQVCAGVRACVQVRVHVRAQVGRQAEPGVVEWAQYAWAEGNE